VSRRERYTCIIGRDADGRIAAIEVMAQNLEGVQRRIRINGSKAPAVAGALHEVLRNAGIAGRQWSSPRPIELDQMPGAHAELLLLAVKPLRRADRVAAVAEGVAGMSREEASYWHAKAQRPLGLRALRVLANGGGRR
jgi:hypothetical protein